MDAGSDEKEIPAIVELGGSACNTEEGTVNASAEVGARQVKAPATKFVALPLSDPNERPVLLAHVRGLLASILAS